MKSEDLADRHWLYIKNLLIEYGAKPTSLEEHQFKTGFIHGYKHGKDDKDEVVKRTGRRYV